MPPTVPVNVGLAIFAFNATALTRLAISAAVATLTVFAWVSAVVANALATTTAALTAFA